MTTSTIFQILAVLLTGMLAGLFYAYDCSIIGGLGRLEDKEFLLAFQSINRSILNPYFFLSFMGSLVVLPVALYLNYKNGMNTSFYFLLSATILYYTGVMGITMFGNVPLNNALDQFDLFKASGNEVKLMREKFESAWNSLHHWRTYASLLVFTLSTLSLLKK